MKTCKSCQIKLDSFNRAGRNLLCKKCKNKAILGYTNGYNRNRHKYYMYYLPEEHYIGITNYVSRRISVHKYKGKRITEGYEVVAVYDNPKLAALHEALMHYLGYNGSAYDSMLKYKK